MSTWKRLSLRSLRYTAASLVVVYDNVNLRKLPEVGQVFSLVVDDLDHPRPSVSSSPDRTAALSRLIPDDGDRMRFLI